MKILLTNDDGIFSEGIKALRQCLSSLGEIWVVAPDRERNAISHALTLHRPLRLAEIDTRSYAVNGTPADCINIALHYLLPDRPQLLVAGINRGGNLGSDVNYSGTVAGALEGARMGIPSFCVSLAAEGSFKYVPAARFALRLAQCIIQRGRLPFNTMLNVNVPDTNGQEIDDYRITRQGAQRHRNTIEEKIDPRGMSYYWIGRTLAGYAPGELDDGSDYRAVEDRVISVTPLTIDRTSDTACEELSGWTL